MKTTHKALSLEVVARRLNGADIQWAIFAGSAAIVYGADRPITDIDILISAADGERAAALFPDSQVCRRGNGSVEAIKLPDYDLIAGLSNGYKLDVDNDMLLRLRRAEINGVVVPIIPPEDNILIKAIWGRGPEIGKHDWDDVKAMLLYNRRIDWEYLCGRASAGLNPDRADKVLIRLELLWRSIYDEAVRIRK
ncbi:MAG: hypothetical protein KAJ53_00185 [Anaerolineales bacterium]|nr:hypothetical protein [Anaerolineales bacterium]